MPDRALRRIVPQQIGCLTPAASLNASNARQGIKTFAYHSSLYTSACQRLNASNARQGIKTDAGGGGAGVPQVHRLNASNA